ncbi:murein hydrolase activator EnvC family protein [Streptomyces sp. NPDC058657]|uniref:murein hydrolase activator EnvC family protein n=1 Tax=unclassified Streptomyces TaxID=2593676 RepID=UPI003649827B
MSAALFFLVAAVLPTVSAGAAEVPKGSAGEAEVPGGRAWPVGRGPAVVRGWEPPPSAYAAGHRGVDLAARAGQEVRAAAPGRISFAGPVAGRGVLTVTLDGSGDPPLRTTYEPVRAVVAEGARVTAGQVVAVLEPGAYHCPATSCLHWGLRRGTAYLDPLSLLPPGLLHKGPPRLLPVYGVPPPDPRGTSGPGGAPGAGGAAGASERSGVLRGAKAAALVPDALHGLALTAATVLAYALRRREPRRRTRWRPQRWPQGRPGKAEPGGGRVGRAGATGGGRVSRGRPAVPS